METGNKFPVFPQSLLMTINNEFNNVCNNRLEDGLQTLHLAGYCH